MSACLLADGVHHQGRRMTMQTDDTQVTGRRTRQEESWLQRGGDACWLCGLSRRPGVPFACSGRPALCIGPASTGRRFWGLMPNPVGLSRTTAYVDTYGSATKIVRPSAETLPARELNGQKAIKLCRATYWVESLGAQQRCQRGEALGRLAARVKISASCNGCGNHHNEGTQADSGHRWRQSPPQPWQ
jgi:hypothetical protein